MEYKFCERLKELRQERGIGQVEPATRIGVSKGKKVCGNTVCVSLL